MLGLAAVQFDPVIIWMFSVSQSWHTSKSNGKSRHTEFAEAASIMVPQGTSIRIPGES